MLCPAGLDESFAKKHRNFVPLSHLSRHRTQISRSRVFAVIFIAQMSGLHRLATLARLSTMSHTEAGTCCVWHSRNLLCVARLQGSPGNAFSSPSASRSIKHQNTISDSVIRYHIRFSLQYNTQRRAPPGVLYHHLPPCHLRYRLSLPRTCSTAARLSAPVSYPHTPSTAVHIPI